jgi:alginate O-acetyltransferase complex protein AlgJ
MTPDIDRGPLALTLALSTLVVVSGVVALSSTDPSAPDTRLVDGSYQRVYEDRFERALPGRDLAVHAWNAVGFALLGEVAEGAVLGSDGWLFTAEEFQAPPPGRHLWEELDAARDALEGHGTELLPVIVPDKARIMASRLPVERSGQFASRYEIILAGLSDRGFAAIDLRPTLSTGTGQAPGFMKTDTHWSPAGAERAARAIAGQASSLDLPRTEFRADHTGAADFEGDLLAFVNLGPFLAYADSLHEVIEVFAVTSTTGEVGSAGLFGEVEIPVALVGTSYSARPEFNFEGFLKAELDVDLVNYSEVGRGPFDPMDRYLSSLDDGGAAPRLVIWEIPERYIKTWDIR